MREISREFKHLCTTKIFIRTTQISDICWICLDVVGEAMLVQRELLAKLLPQNTICEFALSFGSSPALGCSHSHSKLLAGADNDDDDYDDDDDDDFDDHD